MDTLWSPCSRSASAAWLLAGSRWSSELFVEQAIFLESVVVVVDPLLAEAAAEDPREQVSLGAAAGPPYRPSRPLLI